MNSILTLLLATFCSGVAAVFFKKSTASIGAAHTTLFYYLFGVMWASVIWWTATDRGQFAKTGLIWPALTSLFLAISVILFNRVLITTPISVASPIYGMSFLVAAFIGVLFLGEPFQMKHLFALVLAAGAVIVFRI